MTCAPAGIEVSDRIGGETRCVEELAGAGHDLEQKRIRRIAMSHSGDESPRHAHGESGIGPGQQFGGVRFESEQAQKLDRIGDRLAPKLLPARRSFDRVGRGNL